MNRRQFIITDPDVLMTAPAVILELIIMFAIAMLVRYRTSVGEGFAMLYETMYEFFEEIV